MKVPDFGHYKAKGASEARTLEARTSVASNALALTLVGFIIQSFLIFVPIVIGIISSGGMTRLLSRNLFDIEDFDLNFKSKRNRRKFLTENRRRKFFITENYDDGRG